MLIDVKADVNAANLHGCTALSRAARKGHTATVQMLLEAKADVSLVNDDGSTALMLASRTKQTNCVNVLISAFLGSLRQNQTIMDDAAASQNHKGSELTNAKRRGSERESPSKRAKR